MATDSARLTSALTGRYRVERELGAGGMATVYLAHDVRHDRRVALKVLRAELSAVIGAERFLAEIRTTANLHHPHILPLFDSGQVEGTVFYVMPYVDGESLRDRLDREKQLPIEDALRIAREVGDALQYAHGHGVIHRDIKPENVLLQGGHALVADFGIALAAARTGGSRMTETGMSLGTPRYMSPEQAMGEREIDARSDLYALGCVLYEMLTGEPPFTGTTAQAIVAKVLTEKPASIIARRDRVPPFVEDAVLTALEKLPADRFATVADFVGALRGDVAVTATRRLPSARPVPARQRTGLAASAVGLVALGALGGWLASRGGTAPVPVTPSRLALVEPRASVAWDGARRTIAISRDGQTVVFAVARPDGFAVVSRRLDTGASRELARGPEANLRLSPDEKYLYASWGSGTMRRMAIAGGGWSNIAGTEATPFVDFSDDGTMWWGSFLGAGTSRTSPDGNTSRVFAMGTITKVLPGGTHALGVRLHTGTNAGVMLFMDLRTGGVREISDIPVVDAGYTMGYVVYVLLDNSLMAAPFDARGGRITGPAVTLATDISVSTIGFAQMAIADNGTVVYVPGSESDLVQVTRDGRQRVLLDARRRYHALRISPDGTRIAYDDVSSEGRDVWIHTIGTTSVTRATFQRDGHDAEWTSDGRGLRFLTAINKDRLDVFRIALGTTAAAQAEGMPVPLSHTGTPVHGDSTVITTVIGDGGRGLDVVRVAPNATRVDTLLATDADESYAIASPDGRWFAYTSDHSGRPELYIRSLGGSDVQLTVSLEGATEPVWGRDGREIFYRAGSRLMAAKLRLDDEPAVLERLDLFDVSGYDAAAPHAAYDVSPDGQWFVFARRGSATHVVVLQNIHEMARRLASSSGGTP